MTIGFVSTYRKLSRENNKMRKEISLKCTSKIPGGIGAALRIGTIKTLSFHKKEYINLSSYLK